MSFVPGHSSRRRLELVRIVLLLLLAFFAAARGFSQQAAPVAPAKPLANFIDISQKAGLTMSEVFGGVDSKKYIIETTGTGVAIFDYDNDGWPDILSSTAPRSRPRKRATGRRTISITTTTTAPSPT